MRPTYAVIDLGTNTFHLLLVEALTGGRFREIHRESRFIKLGEEGLKTIGAAAFARGISTLEDYQKILDQYHTEQVVALGTAALRTASNGPLFVKTAARKTNINIQLISGDKEAELIYKGVKQAVPFGKTKSLIMDIGGGSVEYIITDKNKIYWAQSFPVGVAVLFKNFHDSDPISNESIKSLTRYLHTELTPLIEELQQHKIDNLIGASGTFDVLEQVLVEHKEDDLHSHLAASLFYPYYEKIIRTTQAERYAMPDLPDSRADMIVVALLLIHFTLQIADIQRITISAYAMKEGLLSELLQGSGG